MPGRWDACEPARRVQPCSARQLTVATNPLHDCPPPSHAARAWRPRRWRAGSRCFITSRPWPLCATIWRVRVTAAGLALTNLCCALRCALRCRPVAGRTGRAAACSLACGICAHPFPTACMHMCRMRAPHLTASCRPASCAPPPFCSRGVPAAGCGRACISSRGPGYQLRPAQRGVPLARGSGRGRRRGSVGGGASTADGAAGGAGGT